MEKCFQNFEEVSKEHREKVLSHFSSEWSFWTLEEVEKFLQTEAAFAYLWSDETLSNSELLELKSNYRSMDSKGYRKPSCDDHTVVKGFVLFSVTVDSADLLYLYVPKAYRRSGIGANLLKYATEELFKRGVREIFLEVSSQNTPALTLYEGLGYDKIDLRKKYYKNGDDAVIMRLQLGQVGCLNP